MIKVSLLMHQQCLSVELQHEPCVPAMAAQSGDPLLPISKKAPIFFFKMEKIQHTPP